MEHIFERENGFPEKHLDELISPFLFSDTSPPKQGWLCS